MKEIKLEKQEVNFKESYYPTSDLEIFKHCCGQTSLKKDSIDYYRPIFKAHGYKLMVPYTLERYADIIYRVDDGHAFNRGGGVYYSGVDDFTGRVFDQFSPYYFTSNKEEL